MIDKLHLQNSFIFIRELVFWLLLCSISSLENLFPLLSVIFSTMCNLRIHPTPITSTENTMHPCYHGCSCYIKEIYYYEWFLFMDSFYAIAYWLNHTASNSLSRIWIKRELKIEYGIIITSRYLIYLVI